MYTDLFRDLCLSHERQTNEEMHWEVDAVTEKSAMFPYISKIIYIQYLIEYYNRANILSDHEMVETLLEGS